MVGWMAICINSREVAQGIYFNPKKKKKFGENYILHLHYER